ncbi:hypothetical protein DIPPA_34672 [Diplonema papillatum]|nr:hypothetical protein DIPPA_34672 [Diplonema papillatum]
MDRAQAAGLVPDRLDEVVLTVAAATAPDVETLESDDNDTLSPTDARGAAGEGDGDDEPWKILFAVHRVRGATGKNQHTEGKAANRLG